MHTYKEGNIQRRSYMNPTEKLWDDFAKELKRENPKGFSYQGGTSNSSNNSLQDHIVARNAKFDFVFSFTEWDTQVYENIPGYNKGNFTGELKEWMWDFNFVLNIEVKEVGRGNWGSVMPNRFCDAFGVSRKKDIRNQWLIVDFSNVLKLRNHGGIIYVKEKNDTTVHHIFHEEDISNACIRGYHMDWEGDPNKAGGGGYKAKTLLNKEHSIKFETFEEVKQYIRSMADCKLWQQKEINRRLFHKNLIHKNIMEYSPNKVGEQSPVILHEGLLKPAPKKQITCEEVEANE